MRRIITIHDPDASILRRRSRPAPRVTREIRALIREMLETMYASNGVGLAAPQVGVPLRVIVADIGKGPLVLVNPRIVRRSGEQVGPEGCLSIPGVAGIVKRARRIVVTGQTQNGRKKTLIAEDLLARVILHEVDHLNGVLFIDRVEGGMLYTVEREEKAARPMSASLPLGVMGDDGAV
ncbi:MAG: peptide deformylase [Armatimonadota bacterium]|nr:peptide deformylase [Armatimonadota bacterium]